MEDVVHGVFLLLGLVTVGCVLLITVYLILSGLPAITKIGLGNSCSAPSGPRRPPTRNTAFSPLYSHQRLWHLRRNPARRAGRVPDGGVPVKMAPKKLRSVMESAVSLLCRYPVGCLWSGRYAGARSRHPEAVPRAGRRKPACRDGRAGNYDPAVHYYVSINALDAVPKEYEDASLALGATPVETWFRVSAPAARSGIAAAVVLGVGRAIGEAMAVMMVSGNAPNMPSLFESVRFLTTAVASEMSYASGLQRQALFSIALVLYLFIMLINAALNFFLKRKKRSETMLTNKLSAARRVYTAVMRVLLLLPPC